MGMGYILYNGGYNKPIKKQAHQTSKCKQKDIIVRRPKSMSRDRKPTKIESKLNLALSQTNLEWIHVRITP